MTSEKEPFPSLGFSDRLATARRRFFVGRAAELELFRQVLLAEEAPLAVLHIFGPGGVGKTRLAIEAATRRAGDFRHGVAFVPLQPLPVAEAVAPAIADALHLPLSRHTEPRSRLRRFLQREKTCSCHRITRNTRRPPFSSDTDADIIRA